MSDSVHFSYVENELLSINLAKAVWGLHVLFGDRTNKMQQFDYNVSLCVELKIWKLLRKPIYSQCRLVVKPNCYHLVAK